MKKIRRISNGKVEKVGDYFKNSISSIFRGNKDKYLTAYIKIHWEDIVGKNTANKVTLINILNKELLLYTLTPAWATELKFLEEGIISKVNLYAGKNFVKKIKFVAIPPREKKILSTAAQNKDTLKNDFTLEKLSVKEEKSIKDAVAGVKDEDLRAALERYGKAIKRIKNYKRDNLIKCKICGEFNGHEICYKCQIDKNNKLRLKVRELLTEVPFLSFADVKKEIPEITADTLRKIRMDMAQRLAQEINPKEGATFKAKILTMLYRAMPPEFVTEEMVIKTLRHLRFDLATPPG